MGVQVTDEQVIAIIAAIMQAGENICYDLQKNPRWETSDSDELVQRATNLLKTAYESRGGSA